MAMPVNASEPDIGLGSMSCEPLRTSPPPGQCYFLKEAFLWIPIYREYSWLAWWFRFHHSLETQGAPVLQTRDSSLATPIIAANVRLALWPSFSAAMPVSPESIQLLCQLGKCKLECGEMRPF